MFKMDEAQKDRLLRITKYREAVKNGRVGDFNKAGLLQLLDDMKTEGKWQFNDGQSHTAKFFYSAALEVCQLLEENYYFHQADLVATLHGNKAMCCIKLKEYDLALDESEKALQQDKNNVKALYRKVVALKHLGRIREALTTAEFGQSFAKNSAFDDLVHGLQHLVKLERRDATASLAQGKVVADEIDPEWLVGTNVNVVRKQQQLAAQKKMPLKKKKSTPKSGNGSAAASTKTLVPSRVPDESPSEEEDDDDEEEVEEEAEEEESDDSSTDLGEDDRTFANNLASVSNHLSTGAGEDDSVWGPAPKQNVALIDGGAIGGMGLDDFGVPSTAPVVRPSSGAANKLKKRESSVEPKLPTVDFSWPLEEKYDFRLACRRCYMQTGQGVRGHSYNENLQHACERKLLIVRVKKGKDTDTNWLEIRPRVNSAQGFVSAYKICKQFSSGIPCQVSKERCSFPHHQAELRLWCMDRDGQFDISDFIAKLKANGIYTSEQLAARMPKKTQEEKAEKKIPGLTFVDTSKKSGKSSQAAPEPATSQQTRQASAPMASSTRNPAATPALATGPPPQKAAPMQRAAPPTVAPSARVFYNSNPNSVSGGDGLMPFPTNAPPRRGLMPEPTYQYNAPSPVIVQSFSGQGDEESDKGNAFPLAPEFEYKFMCSKCLIYTNQPGRFAANPHQHSCDATTLVVFKRGQFAMGPWYRVRERLNHRNFHGNYLLCNSIRYNNMNLCKYKEDKCSFAHNEIEQRLWSMEKDGQFNITEFIMQNNGSSEQAKGFTIQELFRKHGINFYFICQDCYFSNPPRHTVYHSKGYCQSYYRHPFRKLMVHSAIDNRMLTPIFERRMLKPNAFYLICYNGRFCYNLRYNKCSFAHSLVERDVWMVERDMNITKDEIVLAATNVRNGMPLHMVGPAQQSAPAAQTKKEKEPEDICPYIVKELCGTCWKNGLRTPQAGNKDRCEKDHNNWSQIRKYFLLPSLSEVRPLPRIIPNGLKFIICQFIRQKKRCTYNLGGPCQFAHNEEELECWKWMCLNKVKTLEELSRLSQQAQKAKEAAKAKLVQGDNVVSVTRSHNPAILAPSDLSDMTFYCPHCATHCNSQRQWDNHCASEKHTFNVNSDSDHQWNFRQPPWGQSSYSLCERHLHKRCQYSMAPDMYNYCTQAHSQEELDEWNERKAWRTMKRDMARNQNLFSYMDKLLERYHSAEAGVSVLTESADYAEIECNQDLVVYKEDKTTRFLWSFSVRATEKLAKVSMLLNRDRLYFCLLEKENAERLSPQGAHQICSGDIFFEYEADEVYHYKVYVGFFGKIYGSFSQWVTFDFDVQNYPVLYRKISIELGNRKYHEQVKTLREKLSFDHWTGENREIIGVGEKDELERRYKSPLSSDMVVTQATLKTQLNRHNYKHKMHQLLYLEEMTRHRIISSFNHTTRIELFATLTETRSGMCHAREGELFAKVPLADYLTEDTNAGKLILSSVRQVLVAPCGQSSRQVYMADMVREDNFNFDGRNKHYIFINLPEEFVKDFKLKDKTSLEVEMQFQMNRLHFCRMHFAVDSLANTDIAFPDISKVNMQAVRHLGQVSSKVLNADQLMAVRHIVAEHQGYTPPFIINGPFGTGKTATLAQCIMTLVKDSPYARILICAQSNSAADLYITKHLDAFLTKRKMEGVLLRVYSSERHLNTVPEVVRKYCLMDTVKYAFRQPNKEEVIRNRIIITTVETSMQLLPLGLQGHFTHIFIDEAAQGLECETVMPLCLASERTCVVLTGDHMQMSPKVYSPEARMQHFHISMLERLFNYYEANCVHNEQMRSSPLNLLLSINYRTKMEILRFISAIFYGGPDNLKAMGNVPSVVELTPMVFYCVQGCEVQDPDRTSYYNSSEIEETVERVEELYKNWPQEWGQPNASEIQVVTPYYDQVIRIRRALRQKNVALRDVNVNRVHECQGKEYRALFISTVRTRHLLSSTHVHNAIMAEDCDGDIGDFGFLSDGKLLNTAFTRAQSFVAVVGDPVALCAIGECVTVWRTYLKHCDNMKSLHPPQFTYQSVKSAVIQLQLSPEGNRLKEIMEMMHGIMPMEDDVSGDTLASTSTAAAQPHLAASQPRPGSTPSSLVPAASVMPQPQLLNPAAGFGVQQPNMRPAMGPAMPASLMSQQQQQQSQQFMQPQRMQSHVSSLQPMATGIPSTMGAAPMSPMSSLSSLSMPQQQQHQQHLLAASQGYGQMPGLSLVPQSSAAAAASVGMPFSASLPAQLPSTSPLVSATPPVMPSFHAQPPGVGFSAPLRTPLSMPLPRAPTPLTLLPGMPVLSAPGIRPLGMVRVALSPEEMVVEMLQDQQVKIFRQVCQDSLTASRKDGLGARPVDPREVRVDCASAEFDSQACHMLLQYSATQAATRRQQGLPDDVMGPEISDFKDPGTGIQRQLYNLTRASAHAEYMKNPSIYKVGLMHMDDADNFRALILDSNSEVSTLQMASSHDCGQAFHGDEVVVALLDSQSIWDANSGHFGKVIGILRRRVDEEKVVFVCRVEYDRPGRLIPLTPGIPVMWALTTPLHPPKQHSVCVYQASQASLSFSHYELVDGVDPCRKLFMARYLKWDNDHNVPLAVVFGVLDSGSTVTCAKTVLDVECRMIRKFKPETESQMNQLFPLGFTVPAAVYARSVRLQELFCFSITPEGSPGSVLAYNVDQGEGHYIVQVHISNVAALIPNSTSLDAEASARGMESTAPGCEPVHMLPPRLGSDLSLFKVNMERLALTVRLTVLQDGTVVSTEIARSAVRLHRQFTYAEVEGVVSHKMSLAPYEDSLLIVIQQFALLWRKGRLGSASLQCDMPLGASKFPRTQLMLEEVATQVNLQMAGKLQLVFPNCVPLLVQRPPSAAALQEWCRAHAKDANCALALAKPFLTGLSICLCQEVCLCVQNYMRIHPCEGGEYFHLSGAVWRRIVEAMYRDPLELQQLLASTTLHPQVALATHHLLELLETPHFTLGQPTTSPAHYSLNVGAITSCTNPVQSFLDLTVQRMMCALIDGQLQTFTQADLEAVCHQANQAMDRARRHFQGGLALSIAVALQKKPVVNCPIVENANTSALKLFFPEIKAGPAWERTVDLEALGPCEVVEGPGQNSITVSWQERIYNAAAPAHSLPIESAPCRPAPLDPDWLVQKVPAWLWQSLIQAARQESQEKIFERITAVQRHLDAVHRGLFDADVSCEAEVGRRASLYSEFSMEIQPATLLSIQMAAAVQKGMLNPSIQLLALTPTLDLCLEHRSQPQSCFAPAPPSKPAREFYSSPLEYQQLWQPVVAVEAAQVAVEAGQNVVIHNVPVEWQARPQPHGQPQYLGSLVLSQDFLTQRQVSLWGDSPHSSFWQTVLSQLLDGSCQDFVCVRSSKLELPADPTLAKEVEDFVGGSRTATWVGHCVVTAVEVVQDKVLVRLKLHQSSWSLPDRLLTGQLFTVEWIPKPHLHRSMEFALVSLNDASQVAKAIATGRPPDSLGTVAVQEVKAGTLPQLSQQQQRVVERCLSNSFTLVTGPAGTGKTVTMAYVALGLVKQNRSTTHMDASRPPPQLLICAPTEQALDVVTEMLMKLGGKCPRIVRVYSTEVERQIYPLPNNPTPPKKSGVEREPLPNLKHLALHELIRCPSNVLNQAILEGDQEFRGRGSGADRARIVTYLEQVEQAKAEELRQAEIILCTCATAASAQITSHTNVTQIIVEEAGSCMEPEALIPVVLCKEVKQVVMVGDAKQLRPQVHSPIASNLGLQHSLLERCSNQATALTTQYRTHQGIFEYRLEFYSGQLDMYSPELSKSLPLHIWPGGPSKPLVFLHLDTGHEKSQPQPASQGDKVSVVNEVEALHVVKLVRALVSNRDVPQTSVAVLSHYEAHCQIIRKQLQQTGCGSITVSTVLEAQGREYEYVIYSTVRTMPVSRVETWPSPEWLHKNLGPLADEHQVNVAFTRPRRGLIITGNQNLLGVVPHWGSMLGKLRESGLVTPIDSFL